MSDISLIRHQAIFDPSLHRIPVTIIGCGATGSRIFAALVELGVTNITCYDFDIVEAHNLANQIFVHADIGKPKVAGLVSWYAAKTGTAPPKTMTFVQEKVVHTTEIDIEGHIVFLLTDSMASRRELFECFLYHGHEKPPLAVIETRMASTHGNVMWYRPEDEKQTNAWEATLSDDESTELSPCGQPMSVGTTASIIANLAVWQFILLHVNPEAANSKVDIYLKPLMVITGDL